QHAGIFVRRRGLRNGNGPLRTCRNPRERRLGSRRRKCGSRIAASSNQRLQGRLRGERPAWDGMIDGSGMTMDSVSSLPVISGLEWAHPLVREWFASQFGTPTEPQLEGWPHILAGETTLISAPTGSGKTLAAFLIWIDRLVRKAIAGELLDRTEVLYV